MVSLKSNRDSAAAAADYNLVCIDKTVDRILFNDLNRFRGSNNTAVTASCIFFHDIAICFFCMFSLFFCHKVTDWLAWVLESRVVFVYTYLCDNSNNRCTHKSTLTKLFAKCILQVISDIGLTHGNTDGERRIWLIFVFSGKSSHGIVDHTNLWSVSVNYNYLMAFFNEVTQCFCCSFYCLHLFRKSVAQCISAESNDDSFSFIHCKNLLKYITKRERALQNISAGLLVLFILYEKYPSQ